MAVAFFCEELANIKSLRAVVGVDANNVNLKDQLSLKDNTLFAGNVPVISFNANNLHVDPRLLLMTPQASPTCGGSIVEAKMTVSDSKMDTMDDDLKVWWPVKELETMQGFTCRTCNTRLATTSGFRCKALPSEHWYELVECWICHETKPEEHRARMQPISARPQTLLAGTTYLLIHPDDLKNDQQQVSVVMNEASTLSPDKWTISRQWIPVQCKQCQSPLGEGQYDKAEDNTISLLGVKLYKYCISPIPMETTLPIFLDFFTFDLLDAVKAHATYRFIIQDRENRKVQFLLWMFSWNTRIIYNKGFEDQVTKRSDKIHDKKVMKVLYLDCTQSNEMVDDHMQAWKKDKSADHLMYPASCCKLVLKSLQQSNQILPPYMRTINNPVMKLQHNFSVGFLER
ncbi:hypothetical protein O0I10_012807 [Lichtheimia ornata]|uniref:Uncharacterized protein n=1 Tax=Lichtheimia ornata TaxID=688661 RepID=A0AAD7UQL4_9FUNG|nr:uncharacterized protein O0I10_012807 [Lichtheimia ornata]KAJ8651618.1 hypothetical protein O0I10_012807 [Lichtheimia ornata]